jgi:cell division protein FtsB
LSQWATILASAVGLATFVIGFFAYRGNVSYQVQQEMEGRLSRLVAELQECEVARRTLERENLRLLRALVAARNGGLPPEHSQ